MLHRNKFLVSEGIFKLVCQLIVRVPGDQRFFVRKRYSWNIFHQIVIAVYLKKQQISQKNTRIEVSF